MHLFYAVNCGYLSEPGQCVLAIVVALQCYHVHHHTQYKTLSPSERCQVLMPTWQRTTSSSLHLTYNPTLLLIVLTQQCLKHSGSIRHFVFNQFSYCLSCLLFYDFPIVWALLWRCHFFASWAFCQIRSIWATGMFCKLAIAISQLETSLLCGTPGTWVVLSSPTGDSDSRKRKVKCQKTGWQYQYCNIDKCSSP